MVTIVAVSPFNGRTGKPAKPNKNGKMPVILNVISGDQIPRDAITIDGTVAASVGLTVGFTGAIGWSRGEDRVYKGVVRSNCNFFKLDGNSSFIDKLETAVAKQQAKFSVSAVAVQAVRAQRTVSEPTEAEKLQNEIESCENMEDVEALIAKLTGENNYGAAVKVQLNNWVVNELKLPALA